MWGMTKERRDQMFWNCLPTARPALPRASHIARVYVCRIERHVIGTNTYGARGVLIKEIALRTCIFRR